jgi:apolipoprotein D and lipocalin family protein
MEQNHFFAGIFLLTMASFAFAGCSFFISSNYPPLETAPSVDIQKYTGLWYEIASIPVSAQQGCSCTTAEYSLASDGTIRVVNRCRKGNDSDQVTGKASVVPGSNNAKLKVKFFWIFGGDYWILEVDEKYSYAIVGVPSRKYCWILSRTPVMDEQLLQRLTATLASRGFDMAKLQRTNHRCSEIDTPKITKP